MELIESLINCYHLWTDLYNTGNKRTSIKNLNLPYMVNDCPCCDYAALRTGSNHFCNNCPIGDLWGKQINPYNESPCMRYDSPYFKYITNVECNDPNLDRNYALHIANLALLRLRDFEFIVKYVLHPGESFNKLVTAPELARQKGVDYKQCYVNYSLAEAELNENHKGEILIHLYPN